MDLKNVGWESMDWIDLALDRDRWLALVNVVMNFQILQTSGKFLTSGRPISISERTLLH
jgi:hypothetical protein